MEKVKTILWGIFFIVLGIIIGTNSLGITDINIFFDGWWTFLIIIPCFIGLFDADDRTWDLIGLLIGIALFLGANDVVSYKSIFKLTIPVILIFMGVFIIFQGTARSEVKEKLIRANKRELDSVTAIFGGQEAIKDGKEFKGANVDAVFGAVTLDLRQAKFEKEVVIKASAIFGGIDILVPQDVKIHTRSTPIFGGIANKAKSNKDAKKTIYIDCFCMFGGIDIK